MYFKYGGYQHASNEVNLVSFRRRRTISRRGFQDTEIRTMTLEGEILATGTSIGSSIDALEAAYLLDGKDACLYHDDGTATPHKLIDADSLSGVLVKELSYPKGDAAEYATKRTFRIVLEAEFDVSEKEIIEYRESLRFIGDCGPRWEAIEQAVGPPIIQIISNNSVQRIYQEGYAVGRSGYPIYGTPLFPTLEHRHLREIRYVGPEAQRNAFKNFTKHWRFVFSAGTAQSGQPTAM